MKRIIFILICALVAAGSYGQVNNIQQPYTSFYHTVKVNKVAFIDTLDIGGIFITKDSTGNTVDNINIFPTTDPAIVWVRVTDNSSILITSENNYYNFEDSINDPPVTFPAGFDTTYWLVAGEPTGIFEDHAFDVARYVDGVIDVFIEPTVNDWGFTLDDGLWHQFNGSTWPRRNGPKWSAGGDDFGGVFGSKIPANVFLRYNNVNKIILRGPGVQIPSVSGVSSGLVGHNAAGLLNDVQIDTNTISIDSLANGVLSVIGGGSSSGSKNINILISGQSNAWGSSGPSGRDTAANSRVLVWQHAQVTPAWTTAHINQRPFRTAGYNSVDGGGARDDLNSSPNSAFYMAKKLATMYPLDTIRIILAIGDGASITEWFNGTSRGKYTDSILVRGAASGIDHVDLFIWDQGESDPAMSEATYFAAFDSLKATLRRQSWFAPTTPIVVTGLRAGTIYTGKDTTLQKLDYSTDAWVGYANVSGLDSGIEAVHISAGGLDTLGRIRQYQAWKSLPLRNIERNPTYAQNPVTVLRNNLATNLASGIRISNETPATSGVTVQNSPSLRLTGTGWNNAGAGNSGTASWDIYSQPITNFWGDGTVDIGGNLIAKITNYPTTAMTLRYDGTVTFPGQLTAGNGVISNFGAFGALVGAPQLIGGLAYPSAFQTYRTTNAGSDLTPEFIISAVSNGTGNPGFLIDRTTGLGFFAHNNESPNTRRIMRANLFLTDLTNTAGSEAGGLGFATQTGGAVAAERMRITSTGNVLINTTTDVASSKLTISSTTQGFLPPRMTATQASAISSPAEGLMVYVTDTNGTFTAKGWWGYDGAAWQKLNN